MAVVEAAAETAEEEEEEESREALPGASLPGIRRTRSWSRRAALLRRAAARVAALRVGTGGVAGAFGDPGDTGMMTGGDDGDLGSRAPPAARPRRAAWGICSRLLTKALEWCPDAASARAIDLGGLVVAHAELLEEDALGEEEDASATAAVAAAAEAFARGSLPPAAANARSPVRQVRWRTPSTRAGGCRACARACRASARRARPRVEARADTRADTQRGGRRARRGGHRASLEPGESGPAAGAPAGARRRGVRRACTAAGAAGREPGRHRGLGARGRLRALARVTTATSALRASFGGGGGIMVRFGDAATVGRTARAGAALRARCARWKRRCVARRGIWNRGARGRRRRRSNVSRAVAYEDDGR